MEEIVHQHIARPTPSAMPSASPFALSSERVYADWRDAKISGYPKDFGDIRVAVADLAHPTATELKKIYTVLLRANMAIYAGKPIAQDADIPDHKKMLAGFLRALGLVSVEKHRSAEDDGFVPIEVSDSPSKRGFIPYTTKALNWHTDGYYAPADAPIRAFLLHCVRAAATGGENALLDAEILYLRLRDANVRWLEALMHPKAMTIPASLEEDGEERPTRTGPVFAVDPSDGSLISRYTARTRNIIWRDTPETRDAVAFIADLLKDGNEPLVLKGALAPGEGLICNNVLHTRTGFDAADGTRRLLYRARFDKRITGHGAATADAA